MKEKDPIYLTEHAGRLFEPDLFHACKFCGYDEREGIHGIIGPQRVDEPKVPVSCRVPVGSKPLAWAEVVLHPLESPLTNT